MSVPCSDTEKAKMIALSVNKEGGKAYYVGGYVRDMLRGTENKDIDIEIYGLTPSMLEKVLDREGQRISIGESFGIFALKGYNIDIAMPRTEKAVGKGHRDFFVFTDPFVDPKTAAQRRDFTVNGMMCDILTGEILDFFGGKEDIKNKIIRHIDDNTFGDDPLRVLRGAQFCARFGFSLAPETLEICKRTDISSLSRERITEEMKKALLKSPAPSVFFEILREENQLSYWFPELEALTDIEQNPAFHREGNVWKHTMLVLDCAVKYREKTSDSFGFMLSCLTHDMGKAVTTEKIDGVIHSYNHEKAGLPIVGTFLKRLTNEKKLTGYVLKLTEYHMKPNIIAKAQSSVKTSNKMFDSVPDPEALIYLALSDAEGSITEQSIPSSEKFLFERLEIYREYMSRPYVTGKDLINSGLSPDESFSEILSFCHKLRLSGIDKESTLRQAVSYAHGIKKQTEKKDQ